MRDAVLAAGGDDDAAGVNAVQQKKIKKRKLKSGAATVAEPSPVEDGSDVAGPLLKVKSKKTAAKLHAAEADAAEAPAAADGSGADGQQGEARINGDASAVPGKEGKTKKKKKAKQAETEPGAAAPQWPRRKPLPGERHSHCSERCVPGFLPCNLAMSTTNHGTKPVHVQAMQVRTESPRRQRATSAASRSRTLRPRCQTRRR